MDAAGWVWMTLCQHSGYLIYANKTTKPLKSEKRTLQNICNQKSGQYKTLVIKKADSIKPLKSEKQTLQNICSQKSGQNKTFVIRKVDTTKTLYSQKRTTNL